LKGGFENLGDSGKPNAKKAFELIKEAANDNCCEAMRDLGNIYEKGGLLEGPEGNFVRVTGIDLDASLDLYKKASALGDPLALNYLGSFYFNHTKEFDKAIKLFREACATGTCARALNNLGLCFEQGISDAV
jgi:TPR repeat protein